MSFQFVRSVLEAARFVHGGIRDLSRQVGKTVLTKVMITEEMKKFNFSLQCLLYLSRFCSDSRLLIDLWHRNSASCNLRNDWRRDFVSLHLAVFFLSTAA
jgi:hypothetical protein